MMRGTLIKLLRVIFPLTNKSIIDFNFVVALDEEGMRPSKEYKSSASSHTMFIRYLLTSARARGAF